MSKKVIIVESPAKARTIGKILGPEFAVVSSIGHVRDLPKTRFGINVDSDFTPEYVTISGKRKVVENIRTVSRDSDVIYLAADPDREGEAICWHLSYYLQDLNKPIYRISYYEITAQAVKESLGHPGELALSKINAQQARRILDRIVGYRLSPLLWKMLKGGLSAGRVQSVALRLICERERKIEAFEPEEYWLVTAGMTGSDNIHFKALYYGMDGKKHKLGDKSVTDALLSELKRNKYIVENIVRRKLSRKPPAPFITSSLQQEAARRFRFPAKKTMRLAQALYEGKDLPGGDTHGLITYMRTDSPRISKGAQEQAREIISRRFGSDMLPKTPPRYKARKGAQEAHEAIRPTDAAITPETAQQFLSPDESKLYRMIWERFIASQMAPAVLNITTLKIAAGDAGRRELRSVGSEIVFPGFWKLTGVPGAGKSEGENELENQILPALKKGEELTCVNLESQQKFTKPPARFSESTLVKELETKGIGRPSTYAAIMSTIRSQDYVRIVNRKFVPTELGFLVNDMLIKYFPDIVSVAFTARMESALDDIEAGKAEWREVIRRFYKKFAKNLESAEKQIQDYKKNSTPVEGVACPECGGPMIVRWGKRGKFLSCAAFPKCRGIKPFENGEKKRSGPRAVKTPAICKACGSPMVLKTGRYGLFLTCSNYPACKEKAPKIDGQPCPEQDCNGKLVLRRSKSRRTFYGCSNYPDCNYIFTGVPVLTPCPACGFSYMEAASQKGEYEMTCPKCRHRVVLNEDSDGNGDKTVSEIS